MVLSNKKLKEKLRAAKTESLAASESQNHPNNNDSTDPEHLNSQSHQSLKSLLDSATPTRRLSKREKRREKACPLQGAEVVNGSDDGGVNKENKEGGSEGVSEQKRKKKKKRKRDGDGGEGFESGVSENVEAKKSKKKKKKKKKNKAKKTANEDMKKGVESTNGEVGEQGVTETIKTSDSQESGDVAKKVYVGGIPYYSTEDDIRSYFEGCGTITEVDCMTFPESGKFRGIAMISFKTEAAAQRALALDGADMGGLFLKIQPYKSTRADKVSDFSPAILEGYNRIYVGNLSWDITEDELRKLFSDCSISSIRFGEAKETGEFRGYAHVDFADNLSLTMALKLDQKNVCGRPVRIRCAVPKKAAKTNTKSIPTSEKANDGGVSDVISTSEKANDGGVSDAIPTSEKVNDGGVSAISGKIKRRTCYECGEKGHLSSSCPKKLVANPVNSAAS